MPKPKLTLLRNISGNRIFFEDEESYQTYLECEKYVAKEAVILEFDWRFFLKILFGRFQ